MHKVFGLDFNRANSELEYVEMDSSKHYGRFKDILGKGATKIVYKAFDELLGMEVAWNQVKLNDVFRSPEELQRLFSEVHLLKEIDHESIMKFHASWINVEGRTFNFITEMFTSGTLREYRHKYRRVNIHAVKNWACQILKGLAYLHGHDPPVIHRDLKCDNIFVNGHLGQVKIGDLGLATILCGSHHAHSVIGTPEFMAPELYEEDYDELVDVYSFGMCVLEMLTSEYPYSECSNPAQIYKKVTSGILPKSFYKINDAEAQRFVGRCLSPASERPSASELLRDPFLAVDEDEDLSPVINFPCQKFTPNGKQNVIPSQPDDSVLGGTDMTITGTMNPEDDTIFLKVQILQKNGIIASSFGEARNIFFPFDICNDTALEVATEMVKELDITDWDPLQIADMIDNEISALVPAWKKSHSFQNYEQQHSFNYTEEDDDENTRHPFYYISSRSSSQLSLPDLLPSYHSTFHQGKFDQDWLQDDLKLYDDSSSQCSMDSYNNFNSFHENGADDYMSSKKTESQYTQKASKSSTRFCPETSMSKNQNTTILMNQRPKLTKVRSLVDIRSQLLHRSLVEEINKRRLFKTVGAIENIGYHHPAIGKGHDLSW